MKPPSLSAQRRSINFWVHALTGTLTKSTMRYYGAKFGIRLPEMRILNTLYEDGNLAARDLVALTAMDKALVSRVLSNLLQAGYVEQVTGGGVRMRAWTLTASGRRMVEALIPEWTARWAFMLREFSPDEQTQLKAMLSRLFVSAEELYERELKAGAYVERPPAGSPDLASPSDVTDVASAHSRAGREKRKRTGGHQ